MESNNKLAVYSAINKITKELAISGISKRNKNAQQGYLFRGIDDIYNTLAKLLAKYKLCIIPNILERDCFERTTKSGSVLFYTTVKAQYDIVSAEDGSKHTAIIFGEAMDSVDKSTNKAMSAAYKYLCLQTFCIPTEGDNDADATTPEEVLPIKTKTPTLEEITNYMMENNYTHFASNNFFNFYEKNGWKDKNGNSITDWKKAVDGWEKMNAKKDQEMYNKLAEKGK